MRGFLGKFKFNRKYSRLYFEFLTEEIPNIIQIFGVVSILKLVIKEYDFPILLVVNLLFAHYLIHKGFIFIQKQIIDPYSSSNRNNVDYDILSNNFLLYTSITIILLAIFCGYLIANIE